MAYREAFMKKLVLTMIALLALITFIRDFRSPIGVATQNVPLEASLPN
jgi:hypothetical protein